MQSQDITPKESVLVHSNHRLAFITIERILTSMYCDVRPLSEALDQNDKTQNSVLVLDIFSLEQWLEIIVHSCLQHRRPVLIVPDRFQNQEEELRLVYLGVWGIVPIAKTETELLPAVDSVMKGHFWLRRSTLDEYMRRTNLSQARVAARFTVREEQIITFLQKGFPNKEIGNILNISNRTVKFHVANILRKANIRSRRSLVECKNTSSEQLHKNTITSAHKQVI
jgi:DNA-binding NarL/FixJ family response regulator